MRILPPLPVPEPLAVIAPVVIVPPPVPAYANISILPPLVFPDAPAVVNDEAALVFIAPPAALPPVTVTELLTDVNVAPDINNALPPLVFTLELLCNVILPLLAIVSGAPEVVMALVALIAPLVLLNIT